MYHWRMKTVRLSLLCAVMMFFSCTAATGGADVKTGMGYAGRLMRMGMYEDAGMHYERLLAAARTNIEKARILNNLAVIYEAEGQYEKAREYYRRSLEQHEDASVYENYKRFMGGL